MGADFSYDPVSAIDEASATGETAEIFADIRRTMGIPLVTSIWRGLAGMDDSLAVVWALARPLNLDGATEQALGRVIEGADLPVPEPLVPGQLAAVGVGAQELLSVRAIVDAYNRSNGMNMTALSALIAAPSQDPVGVTPPGPARQWPSFPALLAQEQIDPATWTLVRHVNAFGAPGIDAGVATLWRHLAHWPGLLALIHAAFAPLQVSGAIDAATAQVVELAAREGARIAHRRPAQVAMSERARATITGYVTTPTQVVRMVTLGHALVRWFRAC